MNVKYREAIKLIRMEGPDALVEAVRAENERIRDSWRAGLLSDNQVEAALAFGDPLYALMRVKRWSFSPRSDFQDSWMRWDRHARMLAELEMWRAGAAPESPVGQPWLFRWHAQPWRSVYRSGREEPIGAASPEDKALFFRMMDATFTPASAYESYPEDMPLPNARYDTRGGDWTIAIDAEVGDDGGLALDERPMGGVYDLSFADGGCAHLEVTAMAPLSRADLYGDEDDRPVDGWYRCCARGWVEGYTARSCGKLAQIDIVDGEIVEFTLREPASSAVAVDPDLQAYEDSPLWEPFHRWNEDHEKRVNVDQRELVWSFLGERSEESPGNDALP